MFYQLDVVELNYNNYNTDTNLLLRVYTYLQEYLSRQD